MTTISVKKFAMFVTLASKNAYLLSKRYSRKCAQQFLYTTTSLRVIFI